MNPRAAEEWINEHRANDTFPYLSEHIYCHLWQICSFNKQRDKRAFRLFECEATRIVVMCYDKQLKTKAG